MDKVVTLDKLNVGQMARVTNIAINNPALRRRIMDLGITKNVVLKIVKEAPLGDPVQIELRGYMLSIRKEVLKYIEGAILDNKKILRFEQ